MITEERMTALLESAAAAYEPPADGIARVLEATAPPVAVVPVARRRWRLPRVTPRRLSVTAIAAVLVVAGSLALVDTSGNDDLMTETGAALADGDVVPASGSTGDEASVEQYVRNQSESLSAPPTTVAVGGAALPGGAGGAARLPTAPASNTVTIGDPAKIVSTAALVVEVPKGGIDEAVDTVVASAVGAGGHVSNSRSSTSSGRRRGSVTVRVPADRFESIAADVAQLGRLVRRDTSGRDVTAAYSDTEARLRVLTTTRNSLLEVLAGARAVGDILAVQDRLDTVQTRMEELQGRQKLLDDQVGMATITADLVEPAGSTSGASDGPSSWRRAVDGFTGTLSEVVATSGTALAVVLLVAALLASAVGLAGWARRTRARLAAGRL